MNISDRIQSLRKSKGITQEQLADAVGVSRQAVSKWEAEQSIPDLERVVAMAEYFDVTTDYLLRGIEPAPAVEARPRANARTMCIIATVLGAAGLILGGGFYLEYQNWICVALILVFDLAAVTVWLLTKGERPRWFWRVNVWPIGALPVWLVSELIAVPVNSALGRFSYELAIRNKQLIDGNGSYTLYSVPPVIIFLLLMFAAWIVVMRLTREKNK